VVLRFDVVPLAELADNQLAARFQSGDVEALTVLLQRYRRLALAKAHGYFLIGGDSDDVEQEGMIGLFKAARDFRQDRQSSFRAFAELCVTRQILTAVKKATRQKQQPLNQYRSLAGGGEGEEPGERQADDLLLDRRAADPADAVVSLERMRAMRRSMADVLTQLEVDVLGLYLSGQSYQQIGQRLGRHVKAVDNALQRIKRKLEARLQEDTDLDAATEGLLAG
jgi:RNA polymerase sporulation-specific sigma factor